MKKGKKYLAVLQQYDRQKQYTLDEALALMPKLSTTKFDGSIEAHIRLNLTATEAKQPTKGTLSFPNPFGKEKIILVFADDVEADTAKKAGADFVGLEDMIKKVNDGWLGFDVAIATPKAMPKIAKLGRTLGTKGLMPNPKAGTVTTEIEKAVKEFKAGKTAFKSDTQGIIHIAVGKVSLDTDKVKENFLLLMKKVVEATKKSSVSAIKSVSLNPTMGPGVKLNLDDFTTSR